MLLHCSEEKNMLCRDAMKTDARERQWQAGPTSDGSVFIRAQFDDRVDPGASRTLFHPADLSELKRLR